MGDKWDWIFGVMMMGGLVMVAGGLWVLGWIADYEADREAEADAWENWGAE